MKTGNSKRSNGTNKTHHEESMRKYRVNIHYEGGWAVNLFAHNEEEAKEKAYAEYENVSADKLIDNLAASFVDGCWLTKD